MEIDLELDFVSGKILDLQDMPKAKRYLFKYFITFEQRLFVKYLLMHGRHDQFVPHTGIRFRRRWRQYLAHRLKFLEESHHKAKEDGDLELLSLIESGKMKVPSK